MTQLFSLGDINPLLVERFTGFDLPGFVDRVRILGDATYGPHEILQGSGVPFPTATLTGVLTDEADCTLLRAYDLTKTEVMLTDGGGHVKNVRVFDLGIDDFVDYWRFTVTLISEDTIVTPDLGS